MKNDQNEKLPLISKRNLIDINNKKISKNFVDFLRRSGKIAKNITLSGLGIASAGVLSVFGVPALPTIALLGSVYSGVKAASETIYKSEPSLMFVTRNSGSGEKIISQDALKFPSYLRGINVSDKACIMGLQTLIGFQRYKVDAKINGDRIIESNGKRVYEQEFSTITHSVNLNNLEALAEAGYIEIIKEEEEFNHIPLEKMIGIKPRPLKSLLIMEKIGFSNTDGLKEIFNAVKKGDKKTLDDLKKSFKKITFRLTDKDFDFEDIYKKVNGYTEYASKDENEELKRLKSIFYDSNKRVPGVLSGRMLKIKNKTRIYKDRKRKINIKYDKFNRPYLDYNAEESFGERIERENGIVRIDRNIKEKEESKKSKEKTFDEQIKEGVDPIKPLEIRPNEDIKIENSDKKIEFPDEEK